MTSRGRGRGFGFGGFSFTKKPAEPGSSMPWTQPGFSVAMGGMGRGQHTSLGKRRIKSEEEYFDDDEEDNADDLEYLPAPGSPTLGGKAGPQKEEESDDSDDPLDAFMAGIEKEVKSQSEPQKPGKEPKKDIKGIREDIEAEDVQESYFRYMKENPMAGVILDEEDEYEYDEDGNIIVPEKNKIIDPLPPIDHSEIEYKPFVKNFYQEHEEISRLSYPEVEQLRKALGIRVSGILPQKPVSSFAHFGFDDNLMKAIRKAEYSKPMPIQAQAIPIALIGRDIIGIAKTGSGKTATFIWPLLVHIMDQRELQPGDGPIGLILAPTRELSQQIYHEAKKFGKVYNIKVVCAYGGGSLWEQCKACEEGAEIIVATPGRLIDLVKKKATRLDRVSFLVFDEADRMFDMGFEPQVRSIANHVRPDRQTLLFSATFRKRIERLARDILTDPVRIVQGDVGEANEDVTQITEVFPVGPGKWTWLTKRLVEFTSVGSVLIFVTRKTNSEELANNLQLKDFKVGLLHGDMDQTSRNEVISSFKKKEMPVLVATDVAARGLDIPHIRTVINFDVARDIDTHTHRVGRTGRAGEKGTAFTLVTPKDKDFAGHLVRNLEAANQHVPQSLLDLAMQNPWFKKSRFRQGKGKNLNSGGRGLGFRERPGLGCGNEGGSTSSGGGGNADVMSGAGGSSSVQPANFSSYTPNRATGPQSDRVAALKSAFLSQYKSNFVSSNNEETGWKASGSGSYQLPKAADAKKRKTRWDL